MHPNRIVFISSFPPRKCGIATYSQDLIEAIEDKYKDSFTVNVCALEKANSSFLYPIEVKYKLNTSDQKDYRRLAKELNADDGIKVIYLQHEFGLFDGHLGSYILDFLTEINKPIITTFHTILANADEDRKTIIRKITELSQNVIVMTQLSADILMNEYHIPASKIKVIPHGTHLIKPMSILAKEKIAFEGKTVISTFGLISRGKGIETALEALPKIVAQFPNVLYLIIGKTHPEVVKHEGEKYREFLTEKVKELRIENNVLFINTYLSLAVLLEYLQRTDLYFFTSKDPQQAVSGTLVYALSAGCPVVSTPIPHALELLDGAGINYDFGNSDQLADATISILSNPKLMQDMRLNALHLMSPTAWQNAAIHHIEMAVSILKNSDFLVEYRMPAINLDHIHRMTTDFGMIQFAKIAEPDLTSGYTIDDNARALIAIAKHFELTGKFSDLRLIDIYLKYILFCQQEDGSFLNYVTSDKQFFDKNKDENLEDSNGRTIWALGKFLSFDQLLDVGLQLEVEAAFQKTIPLIEKLQSPRAISFAIKGLYFYCQYKKEAAIIALITKLADDLVSKYRGVSTENWHWFEDYLTYGNAVLPEALLLAGEITKSELYLNIAQKTFDFLLETTYTEEGIEVVSNQGWHHRGEDKNHFGEQPIEITYTILALQSFYTITKSKDYLSKMKLAFNWFLGQNHLKQIIYNPITGGCYDGLEEHQVNLNQGAESTVCYLLARMTMEKNLMD